MHLCCVRVECSTCCTCVTTVTTSDLSSLQLFDGAFKLCCWSVKVADSALEKVALWNTGVRHILFCSVFACVDLVMPFDAIAYAAYVHLFRLVEPARVADRLSFRKMHTIATLPTQPSTLQDNIVCMWRRICARVASAPMAFCYAVAQRIAVRNVVCAKRIVFGVETESAYITLPSLA